MVNIWTAIKEDDIKLKIIQTKEESRTASQL